MTTDKIFASETESTVRSEVFACVERLFNDRVVGWAWDQNDHEAKLEVEIALSTNIRLRARAEKYRKDLEDNLIGDGKHGFEITIPDNILRECGDGCLRGYICVPAHDFSVEFALGLESTHDEVCAAKVERTWSAPAAWSSRKPDIVFLWKQNDSGLFGRRSDMLIKYLMMTGAFNRAIHFDAPLSYHRLAGLVQNTDHNSSADSGLIFNNIARRVFHQSDSGNILRRTFLFSEGDQLLTFGSKKIPKKSEYKDFINRTVKEFGLEPNPILFVFPVIDDFDLFLDLLRPACVVSDIVDDERKFQSFAPIVARKSRAYSNILKKSDIVLTNNYRVAKDFSDVTRDIHVIPNGAEIFDESRVWNKPEDLAHLSGPIIGYVGNLRHRIDFDLLEMISDSLPHCNLVIVGPRSGAESDIDRFKGRKNVHFIGIRQYDLAVSYIRYFDVAIVPHLSNALTDSMNPLKIYLYISLGVPVVSTSISNIDDVAEFVSISTDRTNFVDLVRDSIDHVNTSSFNERRRLFVNSISWQSRSRKILRLIGL